jgi:hypothetical protein
MSAACAATTSPRAAQRLRLCMSDMPRQQALMVAPRILVVHGVCS